LIGRDRRGREFRSSGVQELEFRIQNSEFRIQEAGGRRQEAGVQISESGDRNWPRF
jgi:hypothetical protein